MNKQEKREELVNLLNNNIMTKQQFTKTSHLAVEIWRIFYPEDFKIKIATLKENN